MAKGAKGAAAPLVIIVVGPPAAGKTTVGWRIAQQFGLPFLHRDGIKETLFDSLGWRDRAWSQKLGGASWELLFYVAEVQLKARRSFVVESNFTAEWHLARFQAWQQQYDFVPIQVHCHADPDTLYRRFHERALAGERHPGHVDHLASRAQFVAELERRMYALDIGGHVIAIDTSDPATMDYDALSRQIERWLEHRWKIVCDHCGDSTGVHGIRTAPIK